MKADLALVALQNNRPDLTLRRIDEIYPALRTVYGPNGRRTLQALSQRATALLYLARYDEAERDGLALGEQAVIAQGKTSWFASFGWGIAGEAECRAGHPKDGLIKLHDVLETSRATLGDTNAITQSTKATLAGCLILDEHQTEARLLLDQIDCKALAGVNAQPDYCADTDVLHAAIALNSRNAKEAQRLLADASKQFGPQPTDPFFKQWADEL